MKVLKFEVTHKGIISTYWCDWDSWRLHEAFGKGKEEYNKITELIKQEKINMEQLERLRVNLDGLAQMTKGIGANYIVDINLKRDGESTEDFIKRAKEENLGKYIDNYNYMLTVCEQCLLMAKAWTGKLLGELGGTSPYSAGKSTVEHIEPTDAKAKLDGSTEGVAIDIEVWKENNEIEKLDVLRQVLKQLAEEVKVFGTGVGTPFELPPFMTREASICRTNIWNYIHEASIYAGFRLGEIRDAKYVHVPLGTNDRDLTKE